MPSKSKHNLLKTFIKTSNLDGCKYIVESGRSRLEKIVWLSFYVFLFGFMCFLFFEISIEFINDPIITTLVDPEYPIEYIKFPGIAVCNVNKISKKKAVMLAKELEKRSGYNFTVIMKFISKLGSLYDFEGGTGQLVKQAYDFFSQYDKINNVSSIFDPYMRMRELAPSCEEFISNCSFWGYKDNCSKMFGMHRTMEGFCCHFNFDETVPVKKDISHLIKLHEKPNSGETYVKNVEKGLYFTINVDLDDYYYTIMDTEGANVLIFDKDDFPDTHSGSLLENIVPAGVLMRLMLKAARVVPVEHLKKYPISKRRCFFEYENKLLYGRYSKSDCILQCKLFSMKSLCDCVPFFFQLTKEHGFSNLQLECTLTDLPCLEKFKDKWMRTYPSNSKYKSLAVEKEHSLQCDHCLNACDETEYFVQAESYPYWSKKMGEKEKSSVVHIFFDNPTFPLYKLEPIYSWYDALSSIGGICGLCMGFSIINVIEILYFLTLQCLKRLTRKIRQLKSRFIARNKREGKVKTRLQHF